MTNKADILIPKREASEVFSGDTEEWELVEEGEWTQYRKTQHCEHILKHVPTGKFYSASAYRSGSYHTDWYYSWEDEDLELYEVTKVTETITREVWK